MIAHVIERQRIEIALDGAALPIDLAKTAVLVVVRQALSAPAVAEIDFADPAPALLDRLRPGQSLRLTPAGAADPLFTGDVTGLEHEHDSAHGMTLRLRAYDPLQRLRRRSRTRARADASAATLAGEFAQELELDCRVLHSPPKRPVVIQQGQSDLDLLQRLAAEAGLYAVIAGKTLVLTGLDGYGDEIPLALGRNLHQVSIVCSNERALRHCDAQAWSTATTRRYRGSVATARQDSLDMHDVGLESGDGAGKAPIRNLLAESEEEATAVAQALMDRKTAASAAATGVAAGDPALSPGRPVTIEGVAAAVAGSYVIAEALHRLDAQGGYRTEFSTVPPPALPPLRAPFFSIGEVSDVDDPDGYGRCRVKLPAFDDVESGWLQIVSPGAGKGKGLAALPITGDTVLVAFLDGDLARGVVLGALYGEQALPRGLAARHSRPFVLRSGGGQSLELSAEQALARLSTSAGSLLELAPSRARLAAASDLVIEAPGKRILIRANAIDFEQG